MTPQRILWTVDFRLASHRRNPEPKIPVILSLGEVFLHIQQSSRIELLHTTPSA